MNNVIEASTADFESEVMKSDKPVIVDFFANWCGPCRVLGPIMERIAAELDGRFKFVKVDVDSAPELAARFRISGIPTVVVFKNGQVADTMVGLMPPNMLKERLLKVA